jgi:hypothetical protein
MLNHYIILTGKNKNIMATQDNNGKGEQGFASMPKSKVREIAAKGGRASHEGDSSRSESSSNSDSQGRQEKDSSSSSRESDGRSQNGGNQGRQGGNSGGNNR